MIGDGPVGFRLYEYATSSGGRPKRHSIFLPARKGGRTPTHFFNPLDVLDDIDDDQRSTELLYKL